MNWNLLLPSGKNIFLNKKTIKSPEVLKEEKKTYCLLLSNQCKNVLNKARKILNYPHIAKTLALELKQF